MSGTTSSARPFASTLGGQAVGLKTATSPATSESTGLVGTVRGAAHTLGRSPQVVGRVPKKEVRSTVASAYPSTSKGPSSRPTAAAAHPSKVREPTAGVPLLRQPPNPPRKPAQCCRPEVPTHKAGIVSLLEGDVVVGLTRGPSRYCPEGPSRKQHATLFLRHSTIPRVSRMGGQSFGPMAPIILEQRGRQLNPTEKKG